MALFCQLCQINDVLQISIQSFIMNGPFQLLHQRDEVIGVIMTCHFDRCSIFGIELFFGEIFLLANGLHIHIVINGPTNLDFSSLVKVIPIQSLGIR